MQETSLFMEGINLLTLGMGFVFIFLIFLVYATTGMSRVITRFAPPPTAPKAKAKSKPVVAPKPAQDDQLIAVLTAAVHHHRAQQQQNS